MNANDDLQRAIAIFNDCPNRIISSGLCLVARGSTVVLMVHNVERKTLMLIEITPEICGELSDIVAKAALMLSDTMGEA